MEIGLKIIIVIVLIIGITTWVQNGTDGIKNAPFQSTWDSTKDITEKTKDGFDKGKEIIDNFKSDGNNEGSSEENNEVLVEVGQMPCSSDNQCNELLEEACGGVCVCVDEICFK